MDEFSVSSVPIAAMPLARSFAVNDGRPQALHRIAPFGNRRLRLLERAVQTCLGFVRTRREDCRGRLETEHNGLKTLEQRVVKLPRDTGPLANACLERQIKRVLHLVHPEPIRRPERRHEQANDQGAKPGSLVESGQDGR